MKIMIWDGIGPRPLFRAVIDSRRRLGTINVLSSLNPLGRVAYNSFWRPSQPGAVKKPGGACSVRVRIPGATDHDSGPCRPPFR